MQLPGPPLLHSHPMVAVRVELLRAPHLRPLRLLLAEVASSVVLDLTSSALRDWARKLSASWRRQHTQVLAQRACRLCVRTPVEVQLSPIELTGLSIELLLEH